MKIKKEKQDDTTGENGWRIKESGTYLRGKAVGKASVNAGNRSSYSARKDKNCSAPQSDEKEDEGEDEDEMKGGAGDGEREGGTDESQLDSTSISPQPSSPSSSANCSFIS